MHITREIYSMRKQELIDFLAIENGDSLKKPELLELAKQKIINNAPVLSAEDIEIVEKIYEILNTKDRKMHMKYLENQLGVSVKDILRIVFHPRNKNRFRFKKNKDIWWITTDNVEEQIKKNKNRRFMKYLDVLDNRELVCESSNDLIKDSPLELHEKKILVEIEIEDLELNSYFFNIWNSKNFEIERVLLLLLRKRLFYKTFALLLEEEESEDFKKKLREQVLYSKDSEWLNILEKNLPLFVKTVKSFNKNENLENKIKEIKNDILKNISPKFATIDTVNNSIIAMVKNYIEIEFLKDQIYSLGKIMYHVNLNLKETVISGEENLKDIFNLHYDYISTI